MAKRGGGCFRVAVLIILVPIVFGLGVFLVSNLNRVLTHETTDGVIVDILWTVDSDGDGSATPVYEYQVDGQLYEYESGISYGGVLVPSIGETRPILYNPADPSDARVRSMFVLIWLPVILMAIVLLIAAGVFWAAARRRRMSEAAPPWADQVPAEQPEWAGESPAPSWAPPIPTSGSLIEATFMGTEPSQMDSQGKVRYRVKARSEIDGEIHRFRGEWMDEDPTLHYMQQGNKVQVRIDPDDPSSYEVLSPATE